MPTPAPESSAQLLPIRDGRLTSRLRRHHHHTLVRAVPADAEAMGEDAPRQMLEPECS